MNDPTAAGEAINAVDAANTYVEGVTPGTATASKVAIVDANKRIASLDNVFLTQGAPTAVTPGNTQLTMTMLRTKILTMLPGEARAPIVPLGTDVGADVAEGNSIDWAFINLADGAHTITVTATTGHTLVGKATLAQNEQGMFRTRCITAGGATTYRIA
jgi:hypothetical protein